MQLNSFQDSSAMRSSRIVVLAFAAALLVSASTGCRSANPYAVGAQQNPVGLVVQNNNFADVDVYAVADGLPTRVGTVTGNSTQRFELGESMYQASDLRIVATPIGGNGRASTGPVQVARGQTIFFNIAPVMRQSSVSIR